jgi:hypothetical protein
MIVDALRYLGPARFHPDVSVSATMAELDRLGLDRAVVTATKPLHGTMAGANDQLLEAVAGQPRLTAILRIDPWEPECLARLREDASWRSAAGFMLHPYEEACPVISAAASAVFAELEELPVPVTVASGYMNVSEGAQLALVAERFPRLRLILTTGGQLNMSGLAAQDAVIALEQPNVFVHTTGVYREDFLLDVAARFGVERIMFATLAPVFEADFELARVRLAHVDAEHKLALLGENCAKVFGLS